MWIYVEEKLINLEGVKEIDSDAFKSDPSLDWIQGIVLADGKPLTTRQSPNEAAYMVAGIAKGLAEGKPLVDLDRLDDVYFERYEKNNLLWDSGDGQEAFEPVINEEHCPVCVEEAVKAMMTV
ncbi:hypothetical protein ACYOEI_00115 [Singulisphaera rosea]